MPDPPDAGPFGEGRAWDRFQVRNVGFAAQKEMAAKFKGSAERMRDASIKTLAGSLGVSIRTWRETESAPLRDFAVLLGLVPDLGRWTTAEKQQLVQIIQAKAGRDEARYLKLMQKHERLKEEIIRLGS